MNVNSLWIQERQNEKDLELRKVLGTENPADLMTKHLARQPLDKCMLQLNQHRTSGRASAGLDVQGKNKALAEPVSTPSGETWTANRPKRDSQPPISGCTESRLGSLRVCAHEPPAARHSSQPALRKVSIDADEELDRPIDPEAGRRENAQSRRTPTCPAIDRPRRRSRRGGSPLGSGVRGTRTLAGLLKAPGQSPIMVISPSAPWLRGKGSETA